MLAIESVLKYGRLIIEGLLGRSIDNAAVVARLIRLVFIRKVRTKIQDAESPREHVLQDLLVA